MIYFTSDNHFFHSNIIKYCNRPFANVEEMNSEMIKRWNERVDNNDTVFHLGDFGLIKSGEAPDAIKDTFDFVRKQLNGNIIFIRGNHDNQNKNRSIIESIVIEHGGKRIFLTHNPRFAKEEFLFNFAGHVHEKWQFQKLGKKSVIVNLSVEKWDYRPVEINEIWQAYAEWKRKGYKNEKTN